MMNEQEQLIHQITGLNLCDVNCGCGENSGLWWFPVSSEQLPAWVPGWMNGADTDEVYSWLSAHPQQPSNH